MFRHWWKEFLQSITYSFQDKQWFGKTWLLVLIALIPAVNLVAIILMKGWRLHMVRNMSQSQESLPTPDLFAFFRDGLILWAFTFLYLLVPAIICTILRIGGPFGLLADLIQLVSYGPSAAAENAATDWVASIAIYLIWIVISLPVYHAGVIQFAMTGHWRSMTNVPANFLLFSRYIHIFVLHYLNWLLLILLVGLVDVLLAFTVNGLLLVPAVTIVGYYVVTAHELGKLAEKISLKNAVTENKMIPEL